MNKFLKPLIGCLVAIIVVVFLLAALKNFIIKSAIELASPSLIGAQIKMGSFSLDVAGQRVRITDFRMYNPPGFPTDQVFFDAPEITLKVDVAKLMKGKTYCPLVVFNMNTMVIVKNKEGKMNVDSIKIIEEQQAANKGKPRHLPVFKINEMDLNVGKVVFEDYTHAPPVKVTAYDVSIKNQKIRNINGLPKVMAAIIVEAMKPTAIRAAGMYAAEAVLGVGFLPALAIDVAMAQADEQQDINHSADSTFNACLKLISDLKGTVKKQDHLIHSIQAKVYNCDITINIAEEGWYKCHVRIKARQYMLAKLDVADGLMYQLTERLK